HRESDHKSGNFKRSLNRRAHRKESAKNIRYRKETRQDIHALSVLFAPLLFGPMRTFHCISPITDSPALTRSPTLTFTLAPSGKYPSTREPNLIKPILSPASTTSPSCFQQTILRAINPAICTKRTDFPW